VTPVSPQTPSCSFSALQRAENSSIERAARQELDAEFRFSALQRAENSSMLTSSSMLALLVRFSALQRAENSSMKMENAARTAWLAFQCSSASRKFLNIRIILQPPSPQGFQCSSASRKFLNAATRVRSRAASPVSVLFSEPKIPQFVGEVAFNKRRDLFQCSSASRKFLNVYAAASSP